MIKRFCDMCGEDWEDHNKAAMIDMVSIYLAKSDASPEKCVDVLYKAYRCRKACIPANAREAATDIVNWGLYAYAKPAWVETPIDGGIA